MLPSRTRRRFALGDDAVSDRQRSGGSCNERRGGVVLDTEHSDLSKTLERRAPATSPDIEPITNLESVLASPVQIDNVILPDQRALDLNIDDRPGTSGSVPSTSSGCEAATGW